MATAEPQDKEFPTLAEVGSTGLKRYAGYIEEEFHKDLRGHSATRIYREMGDNHSIVGGVFHLVDLLTRQASLTVTASGDSPEHKRAQYLCETAMDDLEGGIRGVIAEALSLQQYGYAIGEKVYKIRRGDHPLDELRSKYNDGLIGLRKIATRAQECVERWDFDPHGKLLGVFHRAPPEHREVHIPREKFVHWRLRAPKDNPEGRSLLRNAYESYYHEKNMKFVEAVGYERNLAGLPVMEVPEEMMLPTATPAQKAALATYKNMVKKLRLDTYGGVVIPGQENRNGKTGFKFSLMSASGTNRMEIDAAIKRYRAEIAIVLLCDFMILGHDKVGSFALSSDKTNMFGLAVGAVLDAVLEQFNVDVFPDLCRLNGIPAAYAPTYVHGDIEAPDLAALAQYVNALSGVGAIVTDDELERHLRTVAKLPMPMRAAPAPAPAPAAPAVKSFMDRVWSRFRKAANEDQAIKKIAA